MLQICFPVCWSSVLFMSSKQFYSKWKKMSNTHKDKEIFLSSFSSSIPFPKASAINRVLDSFPELAWTVTTYMCICPPLPPTQESKSILHILQLSFLLTTQGVLETSLHQYIRADRHCPIALHRGGSDLHSHQQYMLNASFQTLHQDNVKTFLDPCQPDR